MNNYNVKCKKCEFVNRFSEEKWKQRSFGYYVKCAKCGYSILITDNDGKILPNIERKNDVI